MEHDQTFPDAVIEEQKTHFEKSVQSAFAFLECRHGMTRRPIRVVDRKSPSDVGFTVRYENQRMAVDVGWQLAEFNIGAILRIKSSSGRLASADPNFYIYLEPYIEFITNGEVRSVIPRLSPSLKKNEVASVLSMRRGLKMECVVEEIAKKLERFQDTILSGDTSRYLEFHKWLGWDSWKLK